MTNQYINKINIIPILLIIFSTTTVFTQDNKDLIIDKKYNMFEYEPNLFFLDTIRENYVAILCEAEATGTIPPNYNNHLKMKLLTRTGEKVKERDFGLYSDITPNCTKIGNNYLMIGNTYKVDDMYGCFIDFQLIDSNFETIEKDVLNLSEDDYPVRNPFASVFGQFIKTNDTLYFILPVERRASFTDEKVFAVLKFNSDGQYNSYITMPRSQKFDRNSLRTPVTFIKNKNHLISNNNYFNVFNSTLTSYIVKEPNLIRMPVFDAYNMLFASNFLFIYGHGIDQSTQKISTYALKLDTSFNLIDSIMFRHKMEEGQESAAYDHGVPPGCVYLDEDGNINAVSYYNSTVLNYLQATPGRIFVSKFTPDMKVICQESYEMPHWKANLYYGLYLGKGEFLVTGSMDSIGGQTNRIKEYYPFIGRIHDGCEITWATRVEELQAQDQIDISKDISVSPNPVSERLHLEYHGDYFHLSFTKIFNGAGVLMHSESSCENNTLDIDIKSFAPGIYFYSVAAKSGKITTGKFIKI